MSGGVDSSVAAAVLCERGLEVVGVSMNLLTCQGMKGPSCCSAQDRMDAREVCERLGIRHQVLDLRTEFRDRIVRPFVEGYLGGRTPSPCVRCNSAIKFPALARTADSLGAELIATGHYARTPAPGKGPGLMRALDGKKDQSYFLFEVGRDDLSRLLLPLGGMKKDEVRAVARSLGFANAGKAESQDVCFARGEDYSRFVEGSAGALAKGPGDFVDTDGEVLGRHRGIHRYTVGQRRGLGAAFGRRTYVLSIDAKRNRVVLGSDGDLMSRELTVHGAVWISPPEGPLRALVKIRSAHAGSPATVKAEAGDAASVVFDEPVRAVAPGQAAVFYEGDEVIGGGWIEG